MYDFLRLPFGGGATPGGVSKLTPPPGIDLFSPLPTYRPSVAEAAPNPNAYVPLQTSGNEQRHNPGTYGAPAPSFAQPGLSETFSSQAYMDAMKPAEFIGRKAPQKKQEQPQSTYVGLQHSTPSAPSKDVPGSGVVGFVNGGALPVFKQGFAQPLDAQPGPVPQHAMSGKRVGVEEGSFAHSIAGTPMEQFLKLFGYGGGI